MSEIELFLHAIFAHKPDDLYVLIWTLSEKQSHWFLRVEDAIKFVKSRNEGDLYIGVGLSKHDYGPSNRCLASDVAGLVGVWADLDLRSDAHPKAALPVTIEEALRILPKDLPPTFLVQTGNGLHAWWLFREPFIFDSDEERREAVNLSSRWQTGLRLNAAAHGWTFDRLADHARVLRIPGTQNRKDPQDPKPVSIYAHNDRRYNPSDVLEFLEHQGVPNPEEQERAIQDSKTRFADKPLSIDPSAAFPDDLLNQFLLDDVRFKRTWLRDRTDLTDPSQSGYDLALANFGLQAGLSEQQVVDLIIHHRRIHSKRPITRIDYLKRTISKAFTKSEHAINPSWAPLKESGQTACEAKPNSVTARALLCEQISAAIGVRVLRIVKVDGHEPTYRVELEATKIAFSSVEKLVGQRSFRMKIASAADHLLPRISAKVWDRIAQMMLNALTVEDGGDEANLEGAAKVYVERYLSETRFIDADEEQLYQQKFKPTIYEGHVAICSADLQQHTYKTCGKNLATKEVTAMLSTLRAVSTRLKRTSLRDQSRWLLPPEVFPPDPVRWEEA